MKKLKANEVEKKLFTDTELELMTILWRLGEGTVNDVMAQLPTERNLAYTSVSTILRILEQKKVLQTRKEGRGHIYTPQIEKAEYEAKTIKHVVDRVFDGTPVALVKHLLSSGQFNETELNELKSLISKSGEHK